MTSITANPRWCFHCHASEAQSLGRPCESSQLDGTSLSGAQLRQSSHLTHVGPQTQPGERFKQNVTGGPPSYLASRAWARVQRQLETAEASFPGKDTRKHPSDKEQSKGEPGKRVLPNKIRLIIVLTKEWHPVSDKCCELTKEAEYGAWNQKDVRNRFFWEKKWIKEKLGSDMNCCMQQWQ